MKKFFKILLIVILVGGFIGTFYFLYTKSIKQPVVYHIKQPKMDEVKSKTVATGSVVPRKEVEVKPQINGIIAELYVEPGDTVRTGQVIAKVRIIPDMVTLNNAESRVNRAKINLDDALLDFNRQKELFDKEVITKSEFQKTNTAYKSAKEEVAAAESNLQLIKEGVAKKSSKATNTLIKSTINGMVLEVPVEVGNSVIMSNTFNAGTTIAIVADMTDMIFEGEIDETEVGKIQLGMPLVLTIGAIEKEEFDAELRYISPKGKEENGAIQFQIKADVTLKKGQFIRAGYSANADIVLEKKSNVMVVDESVVKFRNDSAFVMVLTSDTTEIEQKFEERYVTTGLSDGIIIEISEGLSVDDSLKGEKKEKKKKGKKGKNGNK